VWQSSFEPYVDPTQWPEYYGLDYVPDPDLLKTKKGRRKKSTSEELWMDRMGMVKICMAMATLMRLQDTSVAQNATKSAIPLPHITSIRSQVMHKH
jgi:hypothetical protein